MANDTIKANGAFKAVNEIREKAHKLRNDAERMRNAINPEIAEDMNTLFRDAASRAEARASALEDAILILAMNGAI